METATPEKKSWLRHWFSWNRS